MTNNPTIGGVSRELLERIEYLMRLCDMDPPCIRELRAILDTPAVEGQSPKFDPDTISAGPGGVTKAERLQATCDGLDSQNDALADEISALQSTIARLEARITQLESDEPEWSAMQQRLGDENTQLRDRIAELESGRGEVATWIEWAGGECPVGGEVVVEYEMSGYPGKKCKALACSLDWRHDERNSKKRTNIGKYRIFTAPPAPVAVVLPERGDFEQFIIDRDGAIWVTVLGEARSYNEPIERDYNVWNACLDATAALNGQAK